MDRIIQSPGKYIQGADVINRLGEYLKPLAERWLVVGDKFVLGFAQSTVEKSFKDAGLVVEIAPFGGDVPQERGVCSDVVIRALRSQKVDLQKLVHEDMAKNFAEYPQKWQLKRPDSNIDHRRVPNLETWFTRHDKTRPISKNPSDYQAGDIVSWRLDNGLAHIGVVSDGFARDGTPLVIHNIGAGAQEEDVLFSWRMVGHYRYFVK